MENIYQITDDPLVKTFWAKKLFYISTILHKYIKD